MKAIILLFTFLSSIAFVSNAQLSQNEEIAKIESGNFKVYKMVEKGYNDFRFEAATKPWPVSFNKTGESVTSILIKRAGIIDELYDADLPNLPAYYSTKTSEICISVIDKKIYYYSYSIKTGCKIAYILTDKGTTKYDDEKTTVDNYRKEMLVLQSGARTERKETLAAEEEKERQENTLEGKQIKSITVKAVNPGENIGMLSIVSIGFEAHLMNGTILKTKNLGGKTPYTDFETTVLGGEYAGGDFKVSADSRKIPTDKIEVTAWSKYDASKVKGKLEIPLNYKNDIAFQYQGASGQHGRGMTVGYSVNGGSGKDGRTISIQVNRKLINKADVYHLIITDAYSGSILCEAKVNATNSVSINLNGGQGGDGTEGDRNYGGNGGDGGNGGNAGSLTLHGDGASTLKIYVTTNGGKGGAGGKGKTISNTSGSNGSAGSNGNLIR